jgi:chromosome partitioning protein
VGISIVVLSGKGGCAKSLWQLTMAGEASRAGLRTLIIDIDPERNMSTRFGVSQHSTGIGNVFDDAGVLSGGELNVANGARRLQTEIVRTRWDGVGLIPAGARLGAISQVSIDNTWLLQDMLETSGVRQTYDVILIDTAGRTGSLVTQAMYAADVAYAPITPTLDAVRKAMEARGRVERIKRAHPLRWAGVVLTAFDRRVGIDDAIRIEAHRQFPDEVRVEIPRRATVHEAFQLCERLGDRSDVASLNLAKEFRQFLFTHLLQQAEVAHT